MPSSLEFKVDIHCNIKTASAGFLRVYYVIWVSCAICLKPIVHTNPLYFKVTYWINWLHKLPTLLLTGCLSPVTLSSKVAEADQFIGLKFNSTRLVTAPTRKSCNSINILDWILTTHPELFEPVTYLKDFFLITRFFFPNLLCFP